VLGVVSFRLLRRMEWTGFSAGERGIAMGCLAWAGVALADGWIERVSAWAIPALTLFLTPFATVLPLVAFPVLVREPTRWRVFLGELALLLVLEAALAPLGAAPGDCVRGSPYAFRRGTRARTFRRMRCSTSSGSVRWRLRRLEPGPRPSPGLAPQGGIVVEAKELDG